MARRSLRPHLNQIRSWVRQGRTDAWVAHQLEVTVQEIEQFKRQNELLGDDAPAEGAAARCLSRGDRPARRGRRADRRRARGRRTSARKAEAEAQGRRGGGRAMRGSPAPRVAASQPPRPALLDASTGPAGGHLRPRRRGLRPVAGPSDPGQPGLRRALGGPPPGRGHDRGGPDRDPPRRRGGLEPAGSALGSGIRRAAGVVGGLSADSARRRRRRRRASPTPTDPRARCPSPAADTTRCRCP